MNKQDVEEVIKHSTDKLNEKYGNKFQYKRLVNGYRRFEPVRGMEYKLDLELTDTVSQIWMVY